MPSFALQTGFLFLFDALSNVLDYGFHVFVGRSLTPGDFAVVQTINASLMIVFTAFAVLQPAVARLVAESEANNEQAGGTAHTRAVFQAFFRLALIGGVLLTLVVVGAHRLLAYWLNVPPLAVVLSSGIILLAVVRSVVAGVLHGQQRFVAYGLTRSLYSFSRLLFAVVVIVLGWGALGVIGTLPLGMLVTVVGGLLLLGLTLWQSVPALPDRYVRDGIRLSAGAFVAYAAYMLLLNHDLVWVNRSFSAEIAGSYATVVLLRRALVLVPGAVVTVMYPRVVETIACDGVPDGLLIRTVAVVCISTISVTALYFAFGTEIIRFTFGETYLETASLLGWMGLAMLGYGFGSIWLNLYLATRPAPYVLILVGTAFLQGLSLMWYHETLVQVAAAFALGGWTLALGGLGLYLGWLRPQLRRLS